MLFGAVVFALTSLKARYDELTERRTLPWLTAGHGRLAATRLLNRRCGRLAAPAPACVSDEDEHQWATGQSLLHRRRS
jgi:hypothetical protein